MVNKCSAVGCRSGYNKETSDGITYHKFPLNNSELMQIWVRKICRDGFQATEYSRICSLHFSDDCFIESRTDQNSRRLKTKSTQLLKRRLKADAIPTIFPNLPSYMTTKSPCHRSASTSMTERALVDERKLEVQCQKFLALDNVSSAQEIADRLLSETALPSGYIHFWRDDMLFICYLTLSDGVPSIRVSICIFKSLSFLITVDGVTVNKKHYSHITTDCITCWSQVMNLMAEFKSWVEEIAKQVPYLEMAIECLRRYIENENDHDGTKAAEFCLEQISLISIPKLGRYYSPSLLIFSYLVYAQSAKAYQTMRSQDILQLPSERTLRKITSSVKMQPGNSSHYLELRLSKLKEFEKHVVLMIDEIYVAKRMEYSGSQGTLCGATTENETAGTVLCFMISSLAGKYRDMVAMYPINKLNASKLHEHSMDVLRLLDRIGFNVVCISVDNHAINHSFFLNSLCHGELQSQIANPVNGKPLFLLFDPVHNIKNVYNNFQSRKLFKCPSFVSQHRTIPSFDANFKHIEELYALETARPVKMAYKLTPKCLAPKSIEKSSVKLAMSVFSESTRDALNFHSEHSSKDWSGTSNFISLVLKLWNIINVKTTTIGKHKRDITRDSISSINDWKLTFLQEFEDFLCQWSSSGQCGLTKQTFTAATQMCKTLRLLARHLIDVLGFKYVLLGKLQSDNIESRFGWYRQLAGGNYYISVKQLLEGERKIKAVSLLKFSCIDLEGLKTLKAVSELAPTDAVVNFSVDQERTLSMKMKCETVTLADANAIYYVAGALVRSEVRQRSFCASCVSLLTESDRSLTLQEDNVDDVNEQVCLLLRKINRGGLMCPTDVAYTTCLMSFKFFNVVMKTEGLKSIFMSQPCHKVFFQRHFLSIAMNDIDFEDIVNQSGHNVCGHESVKSLAGRFFNVMMKNFVNEANVINLSAKKRKIKKLSGESA